VYVNVVIEYPQSIASVINPYSNLELSKDRRVIAVDLRNHGESPWTHSWSLEALGNDLVHLLDRLEIEEATLMGHSLGGKAVMSAALLHPKRVSSLVVVDIAPVLYDGSSDAMTEIQSILNSVNNVSLAGGVTRSMVDEQLKATIPSLPIRQFIATNLAPVHPPASDGSVLRWKPNVRTLKENYDAIRGFELKKPPMPFVKPTIFIGGAASGFIPKEAESAIYAYFPNAEIVQIPEAGHWVHSEKPTEFVTALNNFLTAHRK